MEKNNKVVLILLKILRPLTMGFIDEIGKTPFVCSLSIKSRLLFAFVSTWVYNCTYRAPV